MKLLEFVNVRWCENQVPWNFGVAWGQTMLCEVDRRVPSHLLSEQILSVAQGQVQIKGKSWKEFSDDERNVVLSQIGWVFQEPLLISTLSLEDNVTLPLLGHVASSQLSWRSRVERMMQKLKLDSPWTVRPHIATLRDRVMVGVLRAFVHEPAVIFSFYDWHGLEDRDAQTLLELINNFSKQSDKSVIIFQYKGRVHPALQHFQRGPGIICS